LFRIVLSIATVTALVACAPEPPRQIGPPKVETNEFDPVITVLGDAIVAYPGLTQGRAISVEWRLRSFIDRKTKVAVHQAYVVVIYTEAHWQFYGTAHNANQQSLPVTQIRRNVDSCGSNGVCSYEEAFGVLVRDADLRAAATKGYRFQIRGQSGDAEIITVTPEQIAFQLAAADASQH
jgi:hypothetical protein